MTPPRIRAFVAGALVPMAIAAACGGVDSPMGDAVSADEEAPLVPQRALGDERFTGVDDLDVRVAVVYQATDHDRGEPEKAFEAAIDFVNSQGGAADREIVAEFFAVDPSADGAAAAVCEEVAAADVFAVIGELGRGEADCYSQDHQIVTINLLDMTEAEIANAGATLLSLRVGAVRFALAGVAALEQADELNGRNVAIHTDSWTPEDVELYVSRLEDAGAVVVSQTEQVVAATDFAAARDEMDEHAIDWLSSGADTVISLEDSSALIVDAIQRNRLPLRAVISQTNAVLLDELGANPAATPTISLQTVLLRDMYWKKRYGVTECIRRYQSETGDPVNVDAVSSDSDNLDIVVRSCGAVELFAAIANATGPTLSNHSFAAATEGLGSVTLTGMEAASTGIDKRHVEDTSQVITDWDAKERVWVARESSS